MSTRYDILKNKVSSNCLYIYGFPDTLQVIVKFDDWDEMNFAMEDLDQGGNYVVPALILDLDEFSNHDHIIQILNKWRGEIKFKLTNRNRI